MKCYRYEVTDRNEHEGSQATIVIPLRSQVDGWLEQAVESALRQSVPCEVLVVTSPATPESNLEILAALGLRYANLRIVMREPHMRFAAGLNLGIRSATTGRIAFLMSDDWLEKNAIAVCLGHDADIVSTGRTFYAADGRTVRKELGQPHSQDSYGALRRNFERANFLGHMLLYRRETLLRLGGVDETLGDSPGVDDFDMIWCLLDQGATAAIAPERLYNYRDHDGERLTTRRREEMQITFGNILNKHGIVGRDRRLLLAEHSPWFGVSMWSRLQSLAPRNDLGPAGRALRRVYRIAVPMRTRLAIGERLRQRKSAKL